MKSVFGWALVCGITFTGMSTLSAQHLHQHGNHFDVHQNVQHGHDRAGHLTDSLGHHIDGHGRHTGMTGVYENGARDHRLNSHNLRYGAGYGLNYSSGYGVYNSPYSSRYYSGGYATPYSLNSGIGYSGLRLSIGNSGFGYSSSRLPYVAPEPCRAAGESRCGQQDPYGQSGPRQCRQGAPGWDDCPTKP